MTKIIALLAFMLAASNAFAQNPVRPCVSIPAGQTANCVFVDAAAPLPVYQAGSSFTNITTSTDTNVKASPGTFVGITVNTGGTTSTAKIYNDADGTCSSGLIATVSTLAVGSVMFGVNASVGICVKTAGGAPADITILYK